VFNRIFAALAGEGSKPSGARLMPSPKRLQMAVEAEHHLIVAHEVTNVGNDRTQLLAMGRQAQDVMACEEVTALADRGYFNGDEVLAGEGTGVLPCVPKTLTSGNTKRDLFTGQDFVYDAEHDHYTCPAGQHLMSLCL
jgi:hypothetical protein